MDRYAKTRMKLKSGLWPSAHYYHGVTVKYWDAEEAAIVSHLLVQVILQKDILSRLLQEAAMIEFMRFLLDCSANLDYSAIYYCSIKFSLLALITGSGEHASTSGLFCESPTEKIGKSIIRIIVV